jgi:hypothetical protein
MHRGSFCHAAIRAIVHFKKTNMLEPNYLIVDYGGSQGNTTVVRLPLTRSQRLRTSNRKRRRLACRVQRYS